MIDVELEELRDRPRTKTVDRWNALAVKSQRREDKQRGLIGGYILGPDDVDLGVWEDEAMEIEFAARGETCPYPLLP